jgi:hypothetical protein
MKYIITSEKFGGEVIFEIAESGCIAMVDFRKAEMSAAQLAWTMEEVPLIEAMNGLLKSPHSKCTVVPDEITFETFWKKYDDKEHSSKKKTEAKWEKMKRLEQVKAYNYISKYFIAIPGGVMKKHAETYLNAEMWNN